VAAGRHRCRDGDLGSGDALVVEPLRAFANKSTAPFADRHLRHPQSLRDDLVVVPLRTREDDPRPPRQLFHILRGQDTGSQSALCDPEHAAEASQNRVLSGSYHKVSDNSDLDVKLPPVIVLSQGASDDVDSSPLDEAVRRDRQWDVDLAGFLQLSGKAAKTRFTLSDVLHDVEELLFVIQYLGASTIGDELTTARTIEDKLSRTRALLADLILQRTSGT
jgi:hypothetical protein